MIVERTENEQWLSNAYLVAAEAGGKGVLIDGNDQLEPLLERAEKDGIEIGHILITHPHGDHVAGLEAARERLGGPKVVAHPEAATEIEMEVDEEIGDGEKLNVDGLEIEAIYTPGHASGHLAYLVGGSDVFTADVLFKGTVGGTKAPGASGFEDLKASVMRLMDLPPRRGSTPVTASRRRSAPSLSRTRSCGSGGASTSSARSPARSGSKTPRCGSGRPTTTAATRPGWSLPRAARKRSSAARRCSATPNSGCQGLPGRLVLFSLDRCATGQIGRSRDNSFTPSRPTEGQVHG